MARKQPEDLVFWDEKKQRSVKVTHHGLVYLGTGQILTREEALNFLNLLRAEKEEAEKSCETATGETRENLLQFIGYVNNAILRVR